MHIVGITGGTGCGKTTALMELERQGALVIDCDAVYHELLASNAAMLAEINARFPGTIENGTLQRKKLGAVVFADAAALDDLNAITHRYVRAEVRARLRAWARRRHGRSDRRHPRSSRAGWHSCAPLPSV